MISTGDSSHSRCSVAPVTGLHSYWVIGLFPLSTKIDRPQEVSYGLWHRKLFPIIAPLLGQQSVLPLIGKSNKNNYRRIQEKLSIHLADDAITCALSHTAWSRYSVGCVPRTGCCWLLSFPNVKTCCGRCVAGGASRPFYHLSRFEMSKKKKKINNLVESVAVRFTTLVRNQSRLENTCRNLKGNKSEGFD